MVPRSHHAEERQQRRHPRVVSPTGRLTGVPPTQGTRLALAAADASLLTAQRPATRAFARADDGTRTHDLLHGNPSRAVRGRAIDGDPLETGREKGGRLPSAVSLRSALRAGHFFPTGAEAKPGTERVPITTHRLSRTMCPIRRSRLRCFVSGRTGTALRQRDDPPPRRDQTTLDVRREGLPPMQMLTIQAKTPASARALQRALSKFEPTITTDEQGKCLISVQIGSERHAVEVLDSMRKHFAGRAGDGPVTVLTVVGSDREYRSRMRPGLRA